MKLIDLTEQRFGRLIVIKVAAHGSTRLPKRTRITWACQCDCGNSVVVAGEHLRSGHTTSCGCFRDETAGTQSITHGHRQGRQATREYASWYNAKTRCFNPKATQFPYYGGRGITMCDEWKDSFETFLRDMGPRPKGKTLDRFPNLNGNYELSNCRWATLKQQANNRREYKARH